MENVQIKENERIDDLQIKDYRIIQMVFASGLMRYCFLIMPELKRKVKGLICVAVQELFQY